MATRKKKTILPRKGHSEKGAYTNISRLWLRVSVYETKKADPKRNPKPIRSAALGRNGRPVKKKTPLLRNGHSGRAAYQIFETKVEGVCMRRIQLTLNPKLEPKPEPIRPNQA